MEFFFRALRGVSGMLAGFFIDSGGTEVSAGDSAFPKAEALTNDAAGKGFLNMMFAVQKQGKYLMRCFLAPAGQLEMMR